MQIGLLLDRFDDLPRVADWGYDYVEIVPWLLGPDSDDPATAAAAARRVLASPVPIASMCGFLPDPERLNLMVVGPNVDWDHLRAYVTRVFDRMQGVGIDVMGFGSGSARWVPDGFPVAEAVAQVHRFLNLCADLGEPRGVRIAVEPYNRQDANLMNTVLEALEQVRIVNRPSIKLMADFFHMMLNGETFDELIEAGPSLIHAHIAEPGRGNPVTTRADHAAFLRTLRSAGYNGRVTQTGPLPAYASPDEAARTLKSLAGAGTVDLT
jgi:sugar phosphate isomerase/epimerase